MHKNVDNGCVRPFRVTKHIFRAHTMLNHTENKQIHEVLAFIKSSSLVKLHLPPSNPQYTSTKLQIQYNDSLIIMIS